MILLEAVLLALVISLVTGGSLRNLEHERLHGEWFLLLLLPLQLLWPRIAVLLSIGHDLSVGLWLVLMVGLVCVMLLNVWKRWVLGFAALGIALNILVIGLNGAMPVSLRAVSEMGVLRADALQSMQEDYLHEPQDGDTRLAVLGDVITVPGPTWQQGVLSAGDLMLAVGLAGWVFSASRSQTVS